VSQVGYPRNKEPRVKKPHTASRKRAKGLVVSEVPWESKQIVVPLGQDDVARWGGMRESLFTKRNQVAYWALRIVFWCTLAGVIALFVVKY
jgi:hypothetical protein